MRDEGFGSPRWVTWSGGRQGRVRRIRLSSDEGRAVARTTGPPKERDKGGGLYGRGKMGLVTILF